MRNVHHRLWRLIIIGACMAASGCVHGYGACLFTQPVKHTLTGRVAFRDYPTEHSVDHVPILVLDKTAYVYSPALSFQCQPVNELQLVGVSEFPQNVVDNSHVSVQGKLFPAASDSDRTPYLMNVLTLLPDNQRAGGTK
ncbi:MAG TPA: hypothetical protein VHY75_15340 [Steroidobacteraceae bacterium]|jgi:hypothetical protein|nr:hypothetical protein [Steroidobacteraceae bacterium]